MSTTAPAQPAADVSKFIMPFLRSIQSVFSTMVSLPVKFGTPHLKADPCAQYDVSSVIGFSGQVTGCVVVSFELQAAVKIIHDFSGSVVSAESPDFADALGELANMIAGGAKSEMGTQANISVPSVVVGNGHRIARLSDVPCIVIPCSTSHGSFSVEINIKPQATPAA